MPVPRQGGAMPDGERDDGDRGECQACPGADRAVVITETHGAVRTGCERGPRVQ